MSAAFFEGVERVRYEGPETENPLAFRHYDEDRIVLGRRMQDHLRFGVCYWHGFGWSGSDVFGAGTFRRPWLAEGGDPMAQARRKLEVAFEFFEKLGVPSSASTTATSPRKDPPSARAAGTSTRSSRA